MNSKNWPYKPNTVQIEAVQGCNRHCSFCGTAVIDPTIRNTRPSLAIIVRREWERSER